MDHSFPPLFSTCVIERQILLFTCCRSFVLNLIGDSIQPTKSSGVKSNDMVLTWGWKVSVRQPAKPKQKTRKDGRRRRRAMAVLKTFDLKTADRRPHTSQQTPQDKWMAYTLLLNIQSPTVIIYKQTLHSARQQHLEKKKMCMEFENHHHHQS